MEPTRKELTCPSCGAKAVVRLQPGAESHRWQCPGCQKLQTTEKAAAEAAPAAA
jgi:transposase-like protein